ncbi:GNAT family N-acetyltransferase [Enterobacter sp. Bisph1]|uniref:GNAT family N-acetyltransferase n=1 Tax=Enterobacter sp. Bisph1 TaxID=1274399 RepID=UPI00057C1229|nr:GNAT family N-acetyltransferase [Enterobacter sp. Bisph1]
MKYPLVKQIKDNGRLRHSFLDLAVKTFDLSLHAWHQAGYWTDRYIPYVLVDGDSVIANASVNVIDTRWRGESKRYLQIGTVMTDESYRHRGLARTLLTEILTEWQQDADAIYLYANASASDFYPKFGFEAAREYQYSLQATPAASDFQRLDMDNAADRQQLARFYEKSNPFSALPMNNNFGLLMFYCASYLKACVYYSKKLRTIAVATQNRGTLLCFDIFAAPGATLQQIVNGLANQQTQRVLLGFTPSETADCTCTMIDDDDTLYLWQAKENVFRDHKLMLPLLSHA